LLIRYPAEIRPGSVDNHLVMNLDFAPTFLDYAGVAIPDDLQGESFRPLVAGKTGEWRDAAYYHYYEFPAEHMVKRHYGLRTERYKLIHFYYDIDEWELYDLQKDPDEMNNVYGDPAYAEVQAELRRRLTGLRIQYGDSEELDKKFLETFLKQKE